MNENVKKGGISVSTEHIFPVIKKWLYSEKDIFLREIVSNAADAVTKLRRLGSLGHADVDNGDFRIDVKLDKDARTITVSDNGIGMTPEELDKYLCNIALSGAADFITKYEEEGSAGIIGHFGLGFYSAFMVSDSVTVESLSYAGGEPVSWTCLESGEYTSRRGERTEHGTDVVMHISEDGEEYLSSEKLRSVLEKYCSFMPVPIFYSDGEKEEKDDGKEADEGETGDKAEKPINEVNPLWMRSPSEATEDDYNEFYRKVFRDYREPLFHIHINADYPLNFKGVLYFPKVENEFEPLEGQVKLYYNQVFVADNIKEVIPEFLLLLRGVIDCPELPLNVSRSYLQNNGYVTKISKHIVKKVADKINSLFTTERERYEKIWDDLRVFVEYGGLRDEKFFEKISGSVLMKLTDGRCVTLSEYLEKAAEKHEKTVYYCTDRKEQAQAVGMLTAEGVEVVLFDRMLDMQFISLLERKNEGVKFLRADAAVSDVIKGEGEEFSSDSLTSIFRKASGDDKLEIRFEALKDEKLPALLLTSEEDRRFGEMMRMYGMKGDGMPAPKASLVLNSGCRAVRALEGLEGDEKAEKKARRIWLLAVMSHRPLEPDEMKEFLEINYAELDEETK
ncbi:MAG: molecular chaperone HtpG [Clostridia bacterium]|nr:molecular chaperone HtpG [Clostridia bacterium]